jgi:hypothetical protein
MALAPSPFPAQPAELEPEPLLLPWDLRLTPEQFERVCQVHCTTLMKREPQPSSSSNWRAGSKGRKSRSKVTRTWRRASTAAAIQPSLTAFPTS